MAKSTFKVGDKVKLNKVIKRNSVGLEPLDRPFKFGTVSEAEPDDYAGHLSVKVEEDYAEEPSRSTWLHHTDIKPRREIKVGDKVKITGEARGVGIQFAVGSIGEVVDTDDAGGLRVRQGGDSWWYEADQVKLVKKYPELKQYSGWSAGLSETISARSKAERTGRLSKGCNGVLVKHKSPVTDQIIMYSYDADEVKDNGDGTATIRTLKQLAKFRAKRAK